MKFPKFADGHTDGKKVTPKDPLRINARDIKTYLNQRNELTRMLIAVDLIEQEKCRIMILYK